KAPPCIGNVNVEISNVTDNLQSYAKDKLLVDPSFDQQHGLITTFNGTQENADDELQQTHFLTNMLTLTEEIPSSVDVQDALGSFKFQQEYIPVNKLQSLT
ncbi:rhodanese-related sulfurtransferase, partial [Trichinella spiralis]|uniref:rhodanese-related sulfurtransferase n=1 Tax=Trichinella spiralis TaxID=6334 RepID=UPI0001EFDAF9